MTTQTERVSDERRKPDPVFVGARFGRLTVTGRNGNMPNGAKAWRCTCDCGNEVTTHGPRLRAGSVLSCGCKRAEVMNRQTHGKRKTPEYRIWQGMVTRTTNPNSNFYHRYGGRGIVMCDEWRNSFEKFYEHMGARPAGDGFVYSIDRIDNDRGYEPGNCRWATPVQQARNTSRTMTFTRAVDIASAVLAGGRAKDVAKDFSCSIETVRNIRAGRSWSGAIEAATTRLSISGAGL